MIIKIENKIYLLDINSVGKKILNSNKVKIISLFIFITLTSIDVLNFLNLGHQNKIMSENKKAIVVLTGGSKRLEEGFQLLQKKIGNALFISGVNPIVTKKDLSIILNNGAIKSKNIHKIYGLTNIFNDQI